MKEIDLSELSKRMKKAKEIKRWLKANHVTQKAFSSMLGIHYRTLGFYLREGRRIPKPIQKLIFNLTQGEVNFNS